MSDNDKKPVNLESFVSHQSRHKLVLAALCKAIPDDVRPESKEYIQVANLCEACFLSCYRDDLVSPEEIIDLVKSWQLGYSCWLDSVSEAIDNADLSFVKDPDRAKAMLRVAYGMVRAWIWHQDHA